MSIIDKVNETLDSAFGTVDLIVSLKNDKVINVNDYAELKNCGRWLQASGSKIRVQTKLSSNELAELISKESKLTKNDFTIINAAGLHIPFS